ncbi:hypothetical protein HAN_3g371 (nucleomorph) [Hemiselmis andersenii]|uniref:Uncharacterized protein n=1 Tax=Hemiselmis andersenii TaxID=464988 RepID=A9BK21_HEMAN|nr:hypothetical protein HAN_1g6 [Hemiselmis andersenii]XP_001712338.1 hypothetical protein HAN_1g178 [Hemiselmis andersenii]XP_001712507.1 hypothetical protein HAN_3g371 [Hemiselmis andersenii]ABW97854.1 hypothetical protein HAN_1g6 [Hemiselmis andersenii]ABW98013.1 hypothetical protein HAN_1g178 [Hemiselmis andersenii]ABW98182.1 hypothetical protein HAN_3g371 [Hemiselmis andersenii]
MFYNALLLASSPSINVIANEIFFKVFLFLHEKKKKKFFFFFFFLFLPLL